MQRTRQSNPINRLRIHNSPVLSILMHNQVFSIGVDEKADQIWTHIVSALCMVKCQLDIYHISHLELLQQGPTKSASDFDRCVSSRSI